MVTQNKLRYGNLRYIIFGASQNLAFMACQQALNAFWLVYDIRHASFWWMPSFFSFQFYCWKWDRIAFIIFWFVFCSCVRRFWFSFLNIMGSSFCPDRIDRIWSVFRRLAGKSFVVVCGISRLESRSHNSEDDRHLR